MPVFKKALTSVPRPVTCHPSPFNNKNTYLLGVLYVLGLSPAPLESKNRSVLGHIPVGSPPNPPPGARSGLASLACQALTSLSVGGAGVLENGAGLRLPIWVVYKGDLVLQGCAHPDV